MFTALALLLLALALVLLAWSRRKHRQLGVPQGELLYADMDSYRRVEKPLFDADLNLVGRPDYLFRDGDQLIPVEVKSGDAPRRPYDSHLYQLATYCLLVTRNYGKRPAYGLIRYPQHSFKVDFTPKLEADLLLLLEDIRNQRLASELDRSHQHSARCRSCGYLELCDQSL